MTTTFDPRKMEDAMTERPGGDTLSERVGACLRSRVIGTRAAAEVKAEIDALDRDLGQRFWRMFGQPTRADDAAIVEIISAVRALEPPRPAPARPATWHDVVPA